MTIINPPGLAAPHGYSHGFVAEGRLLFIAGQIGWDGSGEMAGDQFADQFDQALANVLAVVKAAGGTAASVARLTIFVVDTDEYAHARRAVGERYRAHMGEHYPPMTLVEVRRLLEPAARVEIEATAVLGS